MHDKTVRKFACVIKVDKELHWFHIALEISHVDIPNFTNISSQSIL